MTRQRWSRRRQVHGRLRGVAGAARGRGFTGLVATLIAVTVVAGGVVQAQQTPGPRIDLKVLLITGDLSEPSFDAWVDLLEREQVPHDILDASASGPLAELDLRSGNRAFYQGVVCSTECTDILTSTEMTVLDAFQADFGIRRVNGYARPGAAYGLNQPSFSGYLNGQIGNLTAAGAGVFPYLVGSVTPDDWTWGFGATPIPGSSHQTLVEGPGGASWVGVIQNTAGFEEMVVTVEGDTGAFHSLLLGHGQLAWVTRGLYLGYTRNYFSAHFDDIFLSSDRWDVDDNVTYHDGGVRNPLIRMSAADAERSIAWTLQTGVRLDMAFNGEGSDRVVAAQGSDPLTETLLADKDLFGWINHTYEHTDLDDVDLDEVRYEIQANLDFAIIHGIPINPTELVTGRHSGLANPAVHTSLEEFGIDWVASQRSTIPEPIAIGPATVVPRHGSSLFYNIGTVEEMLDQFNYITFENCNPTRRQCRTSPATWDKIVKWESEIMLTHILGNQPEPHFLHQGNLAEDGTFFLVFGPVLEKYRNHVATELVQPGMGEAGAYLLRAKAWEEAQPSVTGYYQDGAVHLVSPTAVAAPITGLPGGEDYDGLPSGWVTLQPGVERVIPVTGGPVDVVAPVITVLGADPLLVPVGGPLVDPGVTATDDVDGDLTASVVTDLTAVDLAVPGTYQIAYTVSDTAGNPATATRGVEVTGPPLSGGTIEIHITNGTDDVEERGDGTLEIGSSDLELPEENTPQVIGLRFTDLDIPQGAHITNAWIRFTVDEPTGRATTLILAAHDTANAPPFGGHGNVRIRPLTTNTVTWNPGRWVTAGDSGPAQQSPDLASVIQQIIDNPTWTPGNAIALIIDGTGKRVAESYDTDPTQAPLLHIEYTTTPAGNTAPGVIATGSGTSAPGEGTLTATVTDDGLPNPPATVTVLWAQIAGPTAAAIADPSSPTTTVYLPQSGDYTFEVIASDAEIAAAATVTITATESPVDVVAPVITVLGADPLLVPVGGPLVDPGVTATDDVDGDLTASVVTDLTAVDLAVPGTYQITYTVSDTAGNPATATRGVEVTPTDPVDVVAPVITVLGTDPLLVPVGGPLVDPGVTATDDVDGDLTASVVTDLTAVDLAVPGTYQITYTVSDTAGNPATATRGVEVTGPPLSGGTIEIHITNGTDDVEERGDGTLEIGSSDLELPEENTPQVIGLRFTDLDIPQGAHITNAWIRFTVDEPTGRATTLILAAHDTANAPPFGGHGNVRIRPLTTNTVTWNPGRWVTAGDSGPAQQSPDLASVIQQIIDNPTWTPGNAIALIIDGTGKRVAESYDTDPTQAPLLHIEYEIRP